MKEREEGRSRQKEGGKKKKEYFCAQTQNLFWIVARKCWNAKQKLNINESSLILKMVMSDSWTSVRIMGIAGISKDGCGPTNAIGQWVCVSVSVFKQDSECKTANDESKDTRLVIPVSVLIG